MPTTSGTQPAGTLFDPLSAIPLCWAASSQQTAGYANLGDSLSAVVVAALSGLPVRHADFDEHTAKLVAIGSIGHAIRHGIAVVWGSGVSARGNALAENVPLTEYRVKAIRGPISARHYEQHGIRVPRIFGDPAWFLPSIVYEPVDKKYELGVIPHIQDIAGTEPSSPPKPESIRCQVDEDLSEQIIVFNTWHEPIWEGLLAKLRLLRSCKRIASQSFHGVVLAEAYGIPVLNFRHIPGIKNGLLKVDLNSDCKTDPRIWEFYKGGQAQSFYMYNQRRNQRTDWEAVIKAIDSTWEPFAYDATALIEAFPLPSQYDPLSATLATHAQIEQLRF